MSSIAVLIPSDASNHELISAVLWDERVQGIEERDDCIVVFYDPTEIEGVKAGLESSVEPYATGPISYELIEDQNWNEEWEKTIKPIHVGPFWIRPSWDETPLAEGVIELIIDPKMSFGTGYHESTRLMMGAIPEMVKGGNMVLDAGTGTGVLAFAALKMGATTALSFDIDPICKENAEENAVLNGLEDQFTVVVGTETVIEQFEQSAERGRQFDVVMANINREALRAMLPVLKDAMKEDGRIGLAGLLVSDREIMIASLSKLNLKPIRETTEGDWYSVWAERDSTSPTMQPPSSF